MTSIGNTNGFKQKVNNIVIVNYFLLLSGQRSNVSLTDLSFKSTVQPLNLRNSFNGQSEFNKTLRL